MDRLSLDRLRATHAAIEAQASQRRAPEPLPEYRDYRAVLHVHSGLSHDSRATREEVVRGAQLADVQVVLFTEHPAEHYDFFTQGHQGQELAVLLLPGAEVGGFLSFPTRSMPHQASGTPQEFADLLRRDEGLVFLSHLEERLDWEIEGLTGCEIYNTHADVKDEARFLAMVRSPLSLLTLGTALAEFPQEVLGAIQDYPADYLRRYDELCQHSHLTGISANDAHHNQHLIATLTADNQVEVIDALGKRLAQVDVGGNLLLKPLVAGKQAGDVVFEIDLDPYERSFRHVSTHLLMPALEPQQVRRTLQAGRAYVAFDWLGDPTGFRFEGQRGEERILMGAEVRGGTNIDWTVQSPLPGTIKLLRNGQEVTTSAGWNLAHHTDQPGVYRVEVWLDIAHELRPWVLSNPIWVGE